MCAYNTLINEYDFVILPAYPNPASSFINLNYKIINEYSIYAIHDCLGRTIMTGNLSNTNFHSINVEQLDMGMYLLKIIDGNQILYTKIVKQ
jgi:hypothetical protein